MSHQKHFSINERTCIADYLNKGKSLRNIAILLQRNPSSICREVRRNSINGAYNPAKANDLYIQRLKERPTSHKYEDNNLIATILQGLLQDWSPEQIEGRYKLEGIKIISFGTIYRWLYQGKLPRITIENLRHKGKRRKSDGRGSFQLGKPISKRPKEIHKRAKIGDWEGDTIVSSRGKSKYCLSTFVERKSGLLKSVLMPDRTAKRMEQAINMTFSDLGYENIRTLTVDRGKEFACYNEVEKKLGIDVFFADPYCAWQKASCENTNGLIRQYYPKKYCFNKTTQIELDYVVERLNNRPRKRLGYRTPSEVFNEQKEVA